MRQYTYIAALWRRDGIGYTRIGPIHVMGSDLDHARSRAADMLPVPVVYTTWELRDYEMRKTPYIVIERRELRRTPSGRIVRVIVGRPEYVEAEARYVPSAGEVGWA